MCVFSFSLSASFRHVWFGLVMYMYKYTGSPHLTMLIDPDDGLEPKIWSEERRFCSNRDLCFTCGVLRLNK